jgi:hypothetical protein
MGYLEISPRPLRTAKAGRIARWLVCALALPCLLSGFLFWPDDLPGNGDPGGNLFGTFAADQSAPLPVPPPQLSRPVSLFLLLVVSRHAAVFLLDLSVQDGRPPPAVSPA